MGAPKKVVKYSTVFICFTVIYSLSEDLWSSISNIEDALICSQSVSINDICIKNLQPYTYVVEVVKKIFVGVGWFNNNVVSLKYRC